MFEPVGPHMQDRWLADPFFYSTIDYGADFSLDFQVDAGLTMQKSGHLNAVSLLANNFLAYFAARTNRLNDLNGLFW